VLPTYDLVFENIVSVYHTVLRWLYLSAACLVLYLLCSGIIGSLWIYWEVQLSVLAAVSMLIAHMLASFVGDIFHVVFFVTVDEATLDASLKPDVKIEEIWQRLF